MAEISDELLSYVVQKAKTIEYGEIVIKFNAGAKDKVDVEVVEKKRFRQDDEKAAPAKGFLRGDRAVSTTSTTLRAG
jgi:hypothetical protein